MSFVARLSVPPLDEQTYLAHIHSLRAGLDVKLKSNATYLVGENGSGKSTLLEGIAEQCGFSLRGGNRNHNRNTGYRFEGFESPLARYVRLTWTPYRVYDGFFMRAESFFNFASYIDELAEDDNRILS